MIKTVERKRDSGSCAARWLGQGRGRGGEDAEGGKAGRLPSLAPAKKLFAVSNPCLERDCIWPGVANAHIRETVPRGSSASGDQCSQKKDGNRSQRGGEGLRAAEVLVPAVQCNPS